MYDKGYWERQIEAINRLYANERTSSSIDQFYMVYTDKYLKGVLAIATVSTLFCLLAAIIL